MGQRCFSGSVALAWSLQPEWTVRQTKNKIAALHLLPLRHPTNITDSQFSLIAKVQKSTKKACTTTPKQFPGETKAKAQFVLFLALVHSCFHPSYPSPRRMTRRCGQRTPLFPLWLAPAAPEPRPRGLLARPPPVVPRACPPGLLGS